MWTSEELRDALESLGIDRYDNIFVHSNLAFLGPASDSRSASEVILDAFEELSRSQNIILPAFTYSFARNTIFDPRSEMNLLEMGALTLGATKRGYSKSNDPMFGLLAKGPTALELITCDTNRSFGEGSAFNKILNSQALLLLICVGGGSTLVHEIEHLKKVEYRFEKKFSGTIIGNNNSFEQIEWVTAVRDLDNPHTYPDFTRLTKYLLENDFLQKVNLGRGYIAAISTKVLMKETINLLQEDPRALLKLI